MTVNHTELCANCSRFAKLPNGVSYFGLISNKSEAQRARSLPLCVDCVNKIPESLRLPIYGTKIPPEVIAICQETAVPAGYSFSQTLFGVRRNLVKFCLATFVNALWPDNQDAS